MFDYASACRIRRILTDAWIKNAPMLDVVNPVWWHFHGGAQELAGTGMKRGVFSWFIAALGRIALCPERL